jgi:hypothetical protein
MWGKKKSKWPNSKWYINAQLMNLRKTNKLEYLPNHNILSPQWIWFWILVSVDVGAACRSGCFGRGGGSAWGTGCPF